MLQRNANKQISFHPGSSQVLRVCYPLMLTALTVFAFGFCKIYNSSQSMMSQFFAAGQYTDISWCILMGAIFLFYYCNKSTLKFQKAEAILATCAALVMLLGKSFSLYNNWDLLLYSKRQMLMATVAAAGWGYFFYKILCWLSQSLNAYVRSNDLESRSQVVPRLLQLKFFAAILIGWMPYIFFSVPGNVTVDGTNQLSMWFGYQPMSNHHPFLTTMFFGVLMQVGKWLSDDNMGVLIIIIIQVLTCAMIYSYLCVRIWKWGGRKLSYCSVAFFMFVPMWGAYATTVVKDTLFTSIFALYFCSILDVFDDNNRTARNWIQLILLNIAVCIIRNDGIYRIFPVCVALFFALKEKRLRIVCVTSVICVLFFSYSYLLFNVMGIEKGSSKEMLTIPFQQTARYARDCKDDITLEELVSINGILPYEKLGKYYKEELSDPVKGKATGITFTKLKNYFSAWFSMGVRHPGIYIQATINNTYGYFYPFRNSQAAIPYKNYIAEDAANKNFNVYYLHEDNTRAIIKDYEELWRRIPGISLLSNPGTYTWVVLFMLMYLVKLKRFRGLAVMVVPLLHIAICVASPVNGYLRYAMPLMACTPLLIAWFLSYISKCTGNQIINT